MSLQASILLTILLVGLHTTLATSDIVCKESCLIIHPQQHFCNSDSALQVSVLGFEYINSNHEVVIGHTFSTDVRYQAEVVQVFKGPAWLEAGTQLYFYTPSFVCSILRLEIGEIYLIAGKVRNGVLNLTLCDGMASKWSNLNSYQKAGIRGKYEAQCDSCEIRGAGTTKYYGGADAELGLISGNWSPEGCFFNPMPSRNYDVGDCETLYSFCIQRKDGACGWKGTSGYETCFQQREDAWFFEKNAAAGGWTCPDQCKYEPTKLLRWRCKKTTKKLQKLGQTRC